MSEFVLLFKKPGICVAYVKGRSQEMVKKAEQMTKASKEMEKKGDEVANRG